MPRIALIERPAAFLRTNFPSAWRALRTVKYPLQMLGRSEAVFTRIYDRNFWESDQSRSGPGSSLSETERVRLALPPLFSRLGVRSLLDAPCGDFQWMSRVQLDLDSYTGVDIVRRLIEQNERQFAAPGRRFLHADVLRAPLPRADAILCRDLLGHLSDAEIWRAIANLKRSGARYLITTTHPGRGPSINIIMGEWQPINLEAAPFFFPPPEEIIHEQDIDPEGKIPRKSLGVWKLEDVTVPEQ